MSEITAYGFCLWSFLSYSAKASNCHRDLKLSLVSKQGTFFPHTVSSMSNKAPIGNLWPQRSLEDVDGSLFYSRECIAEAGNPDASNPGIGMGPKQQLEYNPEELLPQAITRTYFQQIMHLFHPKTT